MRIIAVILVTLCCNLSLIAVAEDRVQLEGTSIRGNRELPKVLYIAPWKKPGMSELGRPVNTLINEVMSPLEREVFTRTIRYHDQLQAAQQQIQTGQP